LAGGGNETQLAMLLLSDGDAPIAPSAPVSPFKAPRSPARSFSYAGARRADGVSAILHFIAVKKSLVDHTLFRSGHGAGCPPHRVPDSQRAGGLRARMGDEGKAVGCVPPTALLSERVTRPGFGIIELVCRPQRRLASFSRYKE
jgi:hypothetical protein